MNVHDREHARANNIHWLYVALNALTNLMADDNRESTGIDRKMKDEALRQIRAAINYIGDLPE